MPKQAYFNKLFGIYAPAYPIISSYFNRSRRRIIEDLELRLKELDKPSILLVGAGDGIDIPHFRKRTCITYLDASKRMYQKAKHKFGNRKNTLFSHVDFLHYDSLEKYDAICIHFCLSVTPAPLKILEKAVLLLKDKGLLSIIDISSPKKGNLSKVANAITKWTMFDLKLDVQKSMRELKTNYRLIQKSELQESNLFASFLYARNHE